MAVKIPSIKVLRNDLWLHWQYLRDRFTKAALTDPNSDFSGVDVRLQCTSSGWSVHTGDPSYDQSHKGFWGNSTLSYDRQHLGDLARDLIEQAREHYALSKETEQ